MGAIDDDRAGIGRPLWIFGYGSLMWRPDFAFEECVPARIEGWKRGFFIYSTHHRGTHAHPGLVLALDRGGACAGLAYKVAPDRARSTLAYLRAREQINGVYREQVVAARLEDGSSRRVEAIAYVAERRHPSYAGRLPLPKQARLIRGAAGISGPNLHYLINTVRHLDAMGMREPELARLVAMACPHLIKRACADTLKRTAHSLMRHCREDRVKVPLMRKGERRRFIHRLQLAAWADVPGRSP